MCWFALDTVTLTATIICRDMCVRVITVGEVHIRAFRAALASIFAAETVLRVEQQRPMKDDHISRKHYHQEEINITMDDSSERTDSKRNITIVDQRGKETSNENGTRPIGVY